MAGQFAAIEMVTIADKRTSLRLIRYPCECENTPEAIWYREAKAGEKALALMNMNLSATNVQTHNPMSIKQLLL